MHWVIDLFGMVALAVACVMLVWSVWSYVWDWTVRFQRKREQRVQDKQYIEYELATISITHRSEST